MKKPSGMVGRNRESHGVFGRANAEHETIFGSNEARSINTGDIGKCMNVNAMGALTKLAVH